jgi:hypothetical protein
VTYRPGAEVRQHGRVFRYLPDHHGARKDGLVPRARLVAEEAMGRSLRPEERVLHVNGVTDDDAWANLKVFPTDKAMAAWLSEQRRASSKAWFVIVRVDSVRSPEEALDLVADAVGSGDLRSPARVEGVVGRSRARNGHR